MDVDKPLQAPEPPPPPPKPKRRCFCCGRKYGARQLARHLKLLLERLDEEIAAAQADGQLDDADDDGPEPEPEPGGHAMDIDNAKEQVEDEMQAFGNNIAQAFAGVGNGGLDLDIEGAEDPVPLFGAPGHIHELIHHPPVQIDDWPDPNPNLDPNFYYEHNKFEASSVDDEPVQDDPGNPPFEELPEQAHPANFNTVHEPNMTEEDMRAAMELEYGNLAKQEWLELYDRTLSRKDKNTFKFLAARLRTHFSCQTYDELCYGVCESLHIPTLYKNPDMLNKLGYRSCVENASYPGLYEDVYNGEHYRTLRNTRLDPESEYKILDNPGDIALGLSTDSFTLFKRRRRRHSTAWPIIFINYNLHPRHRIWLENVICVGVIPGPNHLNSFLAPVLEELHLLKRGVVSVKAAPVEGAPNYSIEFVLRAFLIMIFGDIPAILKLLALKGHNAKMPCEQEAFPLERLLMRSNNGFLQHYNTLDNLADQPGRRKKYAQDFSVND
ncbi:Transposase family Tnp2 protein [Ceratobasidium sp. AG-Ba]|nr:Transposase family Tnp2 protein [Ceratobasidium sp. AG-Ba]